MVTSWREMANSTKDGNNMNTQELFCPITLNRMHQSIFILTFNIPLSISAVLGNVFIIVALQKVTSIHPPSKLLLACLASTDLCVGLITQPLYIAYRMSSEYSKHCHYLRILFNTIGSIFCRVSLLTLTAISVDRLLALLLSLRYRFVVTLKRVWLLVTAFWFSSTAIALTVIYSFRIAVIFVCIVLLTCIVTSTLCYTKIYLTSPSSNSCAGPCSARTIGWRRSYSNYSTLQKDCVYRTVSASYTIGLLSSICHIGRCIC